MSLLEIRKQWRSLSQAPHAAAAATAAERIGLAGSFTTDSILPFLGMAVVGHGLEKPTIDSAPYDQIFQLCLDWKSVFPEPPTTIVILWRIEDLFGNELRSWLRGDANGLDQALDHVAELAAALRRLRASFAGTIIVSLPPYPQVPDQDIRAARSHAEAGLLHRKVLDRWAARIAEIGGISVVDLDGLQRRFGMAASIDDRKWYLYRQPFREEFCKEIGEAVGRIIALQRLPPKKCIAVDCDNTLWGGIIGEDGIEGIEIGDDFPGSAYRDFQHQLLTLRANGVMLAICSKNNEADVREVFARHDRMVLSPRDFVAQRINWSDKPVNIRAIAAELNIGLDSMVFIDDSPFEISIVQAALPMVTCVRVPEDVALLPATIAALRLFDRHEISDEDRVRSDMMAQERDRTVAEQAMDKDQFVKTLGLAVEFFAVGPEHVGRVAQLIAKTNQFNLTTARRTASEVTALCNDPAWDVLAWRVVDRFGDYGLVGVMILHNTGDTLAVDTLLMSCRVLGRGVEEAILSVISTQAKLRGATMLEGRYRPSAKNQMVAAFYAQRGFAEEAPGLWRTAAARDFPWPSFIARREC